MGHIHPVNDLDHSFTIDPTTRVISHDTDSKLVLIKGDHNSERYTFTLPSVIDDHDMSLCNAVRIHFINIDMVTQTQSRGVYEVTDLKLSDNGETVTCSWLVSRTATTYVGSLSFVIRYACETNGEEEYAWNTGIFSKFTVSDGIFNGEIVVDEYADILAQWRDQLFETKDLLATAKVVNDCLVIENALESHSKETDFTNAKEETATTETRLTPGTYLFHLCSSNGRINYFAGLLECKLGKAAESPIILAGGDSFMNIEIDSEGAINVYKIDMSNDGVPGVMDVTREQLANVRYKRIR